MRSKKIELRIPWMLYEAARGMCRKKGLNSMARYFIAVIVTDILTEHRSALINELANAGEEEQDELVNYFLRVPMAKPIMLEWIRRSKVLQKEIFKPIVK